MRAVRINPIDGAKTIDAENSVEGFKNAIGLGKADTLQGVRVYVEDYNHGYTAYHDDDGRLKELPPSVLRDGYVYIVGPVLLARSDDEGNDLPLNNCDIEIIRRNIVVHKGLTLLLTTTPRRLIF